MFVYFDRNGVVREVINDKAVRQGSVNANSIYIYIEELKPSDLFAITQWGDLTKTNEVSIIDNVVELEIPYDKNRDLKFFKDFKKYTFYEYSLHNISSDGLARTTVRIFENNELFALGTLTFNIEGGVVKDDRTITQAQYDYLISLVARNNLEIESIKYNALKVIPTSVEAIPNFDSLKIHAKPNFSVENMTEFEDSDNIEDMWYGCGIDTEETVGFALNYNNAQIGKIQMLINGNKYGKDFSLQCYAYINGVKELVDTIIVPPMEPGVFAYLRFNVYRTDVTRIEIVQEEGWTKDRFYIKAIESFELTGKGKFIITQKNGIVSEIDNPDENYLDTVYQYVIQQIQYIKDNIASVEANAQLSMENAGKTSQDREYIDQVATEIRQIDNTIQTQKPQIEQDLQDAQNTLNDINNKLNKPNGFLELGADGKVPASRLPVEKIVEVFAIRNVNELITLNEANVGDIAYILENGKATYSYRLAQNPYSVRDNWVEQLTTFTNNSAYAERSGLADNSSAINGISMKQISQADYDKLADKTGFYIVTL